MRTLDKKGPASCFTLSAITTKGTLGPDKFTERPDMDKTLRDHADMSLAQANLEDAEAFRLPIKGCKYVLHTASPVVMAPPKGKVRICFPLEQPHPVLACKQELMQIASNCDFPQTWI